jgi:hypothetical protein
MSGVTIPKRDLARLYDAYNALMVDEIPVDFDKLTELVRAAGVLVDIIEHRQPV